MLNPDQYNGFISKRDESSAFAEALVTEFRKTKGIKAAYQEDLEGESHVAAAEQFIKGTQFTVILISERRFASGGDELPQYQRKEVEAAFKHHRAWTGRGIAHGLFIVGVMDAPTDQEVADFNKFIGEQVHGSAEFPNVTFAPTTERFGSEKWKEALRKIVADVHSFMIGAGYVPMLRRSQPDNDMRGADRVALSPAEHRYISENIGNWLGGHIDGFGLVKSQDRGSDEDENRHALFVFDPDRCIVLQGSVLKVEQAEEKSEEATSGPQMDSPIMASLLGPHSTPLMILGPAGAGKTTSITSAAAIMAAESAARTFGSDLEQVKNTGLGKVIQDLPKTGVYYIPIVLRCTALARRLRPDKKLARQDFETLLDLMVEVIEGEAPSERDANAARDEMLRRMEETPYAIFMDGLDEVLENARVERISNLVRHAYTDFSLNNKEIKIVIASRPIASVMDKDLTRISIEPLRLDQIREYARAFVDSQTAWSGPEKQDFSTELMKFLQDMGSFEEFLAEPFHLNVFCFLTWKNWTENKELLPASSETAFFQKIIDYLLKGIDPPGLTEETLRLGMIKLLLRRIAFDALNSPDGKDRLEVTAAERLCEHTLAGAYTYLYDEDRQPQIPQRYPRQLLESIAERSDLLSRTETHYVFPKVVFCEYLAGERIDADALTTASLTTLRHRKLDHVLPSIKFCYSLRVIRNTPEYANNVLRGLTDRANQASSDGEVEQCFDWLNAALDCFGGGIVTDFAEAATLADESGYNLVSRAARDLLLKHRSDLTPKRRAETIGLLFKLPRRRLPELMVGEVQRLFGELSNSNFSNRWIKVQVPAFDDPDAPLRTIEIERTPVLVCEFEHFLEDAGLNAGLWTHAPKGNQGRINVSDESMHDQIAPSEAWRKQRRSPGLPVTSITWYEAVAYAKWVNTKQTFGDENIRHRLPADYEILAIARQLAEHNQETGENGDVRIVYPWGPEVSRDSEAEVNWRGAELQTVSPPGTFAPLEVMGTAGPLGELFDFGSNVRTWCVRSTGENGPEWDLEGVVADTDSCAGQPVCGGSWIDREDQLTAVRPAANFHPNKRDQRIGIRLVRDLPDDI